MFERFKSAHARVRDAYFAQLKNITLHAIPKEEAATKNFRSYVATAMQSTVPIFWFSHRESVERDGEEKNKAQYAILTLFMSYLVFLARRYLYPIFLVTPPPVVGSRRYICMLKKIIKTLRANH